MQTNTIRNLITIKDYLFERPEVIRDDKRMILKSVFVKTEKEQTHYYVEIIFGIYTDDELIELCSTNLKQGGRVHRQDNGVIKVTIYK